VVFVAIHIRVAAGLIRLRTFSVPIAKVALECLLMLALGSKAFTVVVTKKMQQIHGYLSPTTSTNSCKFSYRKYATKLAARAPLSANILLSLSCRPVGCSAGTRANNGGIVVLPIQLGQLYSSMMAMPGQISF
jgi:hypothetical protein